MIKIEGKSFVESEIVWNAFRETTSEVFQDLIGLADTFKMF